MLGHSLKLLGLTARRTLFVPQMKVQGLMVNRCFAAFCKTEKHESNKHGHEHEKHSGKEHHQKNTEEGHKGNQEIQKEAQEYASQHHNEHQNHRRQHNYAHQHHKHGDGKHGHDHHAANKEKLTKMTFDELVELRTEQSMKYAHHKYEHEVRRLKELKEEKEHLYKNIKFFQNLEVEIKQKEEKLAQNIKMLEGEIQLSKKRADKQIQESKNFAVTKIAKELLDVADCIANCKKYADQSEVQDAYIYEITKSQNLMRGILKKYDIEEFDPTNQEYNPNFQQSLLEIPTPPGCKPNHVAVTMTTGYTIKGRLLRNARVGIFS